MIGLMLQALLGHMSAASAQVTPQEIIRRVTAQGNAAGIRLGEVWFTHSRPSSSILTHILVRLVDAV
jgi:hypothetical protein